ncbi:MAG: hypothetical protein ACK5B9_07345 [Flavobacteriia bacterium]|jgi:hypothetical protein
MENLIKIGNHYYDLESEHFSLKMNDSFKDVENLFEMKKFTRLLSASFSGSDLNDDGLLLLSNFILLENLNLQETQITNEGIKHLKKLPNLKCLRLKENPQLTNECVVYLKEIKTLVNLHIHETSINMEGLKKLIVLQNLQFIALDVFENNYTFEGLSQLSIEIPNCEILAKGSGMFLNGNFEGKWEC